MEKEPFKFAETEKTIPSVTRYYAIYISPGALKVKGQGLLGWARAFWGSDIFVGHFPVIKGLIAIDIISRIFF